MSDESVFARAAYMLGRVARGATNAVALPYRATAGSAREPARLTRRSPGEPPHRQTAPRDDAPPPIVPPDLAEIGGPELAAALGHRDPSVRASALEVVGELPGERAAPIVNAALLDPAALVRCAAVVAAARARAYGAGFALIYALDDADGDVRVTAAMALEELTGIGVDLGALDDADYRRDKVAELQHWWKRRRMSQLLEESRP